MTAMTRRTLMASASLFLLTGNRGAHSTDGNRRVLSGLGLASPETVLHDTASDLYLVSNINGPIAAHDNNGFISRLSAEGRVVDQKWIEGGRGCTLNAPKGMTVSGSTLYVADINAVRLFNRDTGTALGEITVPEATFINGLATLASGDVIGTETALNVDAANNPTPSGNDFIFRIDHQSHAVTVVAKRPELGQPNGIAVTAGDRVIAVTRGTNEVYEISLTDGEKVRSWKTPSGMLDGVGILPDGRILTSSWQASCIYAIDPATGNVSQFGPTLSSGSASFEIDRKRNVLLLPLLREDLLLIHGLG